MRDASMKKNRASRVLKGGAWLGKPHRGNHDGRPQWKERAMRILHVVAMVAALAGGAGLARADEPSPEAVKAATELISIMSGDMTRQMAAQVTNAFWPTIVEKARADKIDDATLADLRKDFERLQASFLAVALTDAPTIYARHFTIAELHELSAFYRTPTGAKALAEMPQVTGEFMTQLAPRVQELQRQTTEAFQKTLREHGYVK
jgi:hypothetical protein